MAGKRELIEPNPGDKRYVRRDENGRFTRDQVDVGRSLAADPRRLRRGAFHLPSPHHPTPYRMPDEPNGRSKRG